jgi:hypothetical protein
LGLPTLGSVDPVANADLDGVLWRVHPTCVDGEQFLALETVSEKDVLEAGLQLLGSDQVRLGSWKQGASKASG